MPVCIAVGGTPASVHRSAQYGLPIIFAIIGGMPRQFMPLVEYYKEQYRAYGHDPKKIQTGVYFNTFITDSKDEILEYFYPEYAARMDKIGTEKG